MRSRGQLPAPPLPETLHSRRAHARPSQSRNAALLPAGSTGFRLPDNSVLSPDAALVALDRWQALSAEQRRGFAPLCPDLVVELVSPSDEDSRGLTALRLKMAAYQRNGARLGWLLIPEEQAVEIWEPLTGHPAQPLPIEAATHLNAAPHFLGLALTLQEIWAG